MTEFMAGLAWPDPPPVLLRLFEIAHELPPLPGELLRAGDRARSNAIEHRRHSQAQACAICGEPARAAIIAGAGPADLFGCARWLDACWSCYSDIIRDLGTMTDAEIAWHWQRWSFG